MKQPNRWKVWVVLVIITAIYWVENLYISQANDVENLKRKFFHILSLIAVMAVGYIGWYRHPLKWIPRLWLLSYTFVFIIILLVGIINMEVHFGTAFLDEIRTLRLFFISPVPFLCVYVLSKIKGFSGENNPPQGT